jgi:hypothetical protein
MNWGFFVICKPRVFSAAPDGPWFLSAPQLVSGFFSPNPRIFLR